MLRRSKQFSGPDRLFYGWEWHYDGFDRHVDQLLLSLYEKKTLLRPTDRLRTSLDIGCGHGHRAFSLAKLGIFDQVVACDLGERTDYIKWQNRFLTAANLVTRRPAAPIKFMQSNVLDLNPSFFEKADVVHINFRNVAHFLEPHELYQALFNIRSISFQRGCNIDEF